MGLFEKLTSKVFGIESKQEKEDRERFLADYAILLEKGKEWSHWYIYSDNDLIKLGEEYIKLLNSIDRERAKKQIISESSKNISSYINHDVFGFLKSDDPINEIIKTVNERMSSSKFRINKANEFLKELNSIPLKTIHLDPDFVISKKSTSDIDEIKTQKVGKQFNRNAKLPSYIVIDVETTGLKPNKDKIIELSAIKYELDEPVMAFTSLINPECVIPAKATEINGINNEDVKDAPTLSQVASSFVDFIGNLPVVGYNISFDLLFLYCSGIDLINNRKVYDALELSKKAWKKLDSYKLVEVASENGIYYPPHRALADCLATGKVFDLAIREITES